MDDHQKDRLRREFRAGLLRVRSVDCETGVSRLSTLGDVLRHVTPTKDIVRVVLGGSREVSCTGDHSLFVVDDEGLPREIEARELRVGSQVAVVVEGKVESVVATTVEVLPSREYTYDLSVPGDENFVLANDILAHNSYSIGGINLDLEKSSKYEGLKQNAESQMDKLFEQKTRTVKIVRGLQQPRLGIGVRSSFGPHVGRGVLSPRSFV